MGVTLDLDAIYSSMQADLDKVDETLTSLCHVEYPHLFELLDYSLQRSGKKIRPVLTLLSGKFYDYNLDYLIPMATAVELMHTATLIHDDAIDKSPVRRGRPTVCAVWGEERAILLGDYLFAEAGSLTAATQNIRAIKLFATTLKTISGGEINQAFNAYNLEQTRQQYYQRIARKTASLFVMATESGAALSNAPEESIQILVEYGHNLGIAFQIVDDVLDFIGTEEEMGKPIGSDLSQGTLTLPSLLLVERYPENNPVVDLFNNDGKQENIRLAIEQIRNSTIIADCYQAASEYRDRACRHLELLPENNSCQTLLDIADYIVRRKY